MPRITRVFSFARRLPGVREASTIIASAERTIVHAIQWHIDELDAASPSPVNKDEPSSRDNADEDLSPSVRETMQALLSRALQDSPTMSRAAMNEALVRSLVPDEARILSALSDGSSYPLIHVAEPGIGGSRQCALENASSVGRAAGVALPDRTQIYVARLLRLGLVEIGDEDIELGDEYEILLTDPAVRDTMKAVAKGPLPAKVIRQTIRISDLGHELWQAAQ
jgi:hypothetical protein